MLFSVKKLTVPQALKIHRADLEAEYGDNFRNLLYDRAFMPDKRWAYSLYYKCLEDSNKINVDYDVEFVEVVCDRSKQNPEIIPAENHLGLVTIVPDADPIESFVTICDEMVQLFREDVTHFAPAIKAFVSAYRSMPDVKSNLFAALQRFANYGNNFCLSSL